MSILEHLRVTALVRITARKMKFLIKDLTIFSVNVINCPVSCGFGHIY